MRKKTFTFLFLVAYVFTNAQGNIFQRLAEKTGLFFSDEKEYKDLGKAVSSYTGKLPPMVDFTKQMPPVGKQNPQNSCVAWALGYACRSYYLNPDTNKFVTGYETIDYTGIISPSFIYNLINDGKNKGTNLYRALKLLRDTGACSYQSMPYQPYNWKKQPDKEQLKEAQTFRIETFRRVDMSNAVLNLKAQLASGMPVVVATVFDRSYYDFGHNNTKPFYVWEKLTDYDEEMGHAVLLVGYNDYLKAFKFMNSWGVKWGNNGYGYITYNLAPYVIREAYVIKPRPTPAKRTVQKDLPYLAHNTPENQNAEMNKAAIMQCTTNEISSEDFQKNGLNVYLSSIIFEKGKTSPQFPDGETNITALGSLNIPKGLGKTFKIAVRFFFSPYGGKGAPVRSEEDEYKLDNQLAAVTDLLEVPEGEDAQGDWSATVPLSAFDIPKGVEAAKGKFLSAITRLCAEPVLFVDGFAIRTGKVVEFEVKQ